MLNQPGISLKGRLQNFFEAIEAPAINHPLLLVLDDFEQNIPHVNVEDGSLRLTTTAYDVLAAISAALEETNTVSRLIVTCRYLEESTLPPHRLHLERLLPMTGTDIQKKTRWLLADATPQEQARLKQQRILDIAAGNPRLLEWLVTLIRQTNLVTDELLTQLEAKQAEFRANILAETLLAALSEEERKSVARLSVFQLPIEPELLEAMELSPTQLQKAIALSLVEQGTHPVTYRVASILEPLLQKVLDEREWQATWQQAAQRAYRLWWQESDSYSDAQWLELVRLGLETDEREIVVTVGKNLATNWINRSRFQEAFTLCQAILAQYMDYRLLMAIGWAEQNLGLVEEAKLHCQQALDFCPAADECTKAAILNNMAQVVAAQGEFEQAMELWHQSLDILEQISNLEGRAAILSHMAQVVAAQGDSERALHLWNQSLNFYEQINDVHGRVAILSHMAQVVAAQGDSERALHLWNQSLNFYEQINDVRGKAATLSNMAQVVFQQQKISRALDLLRQSAQILGQDRAYSELFTVLSNLGMAAEANGLSYLSQALWLGLRIKPSLTDLINLLRFMFKQLPQGNGLEPLLVTTALFFCQPRGQGHLQLDNLQQQVMVMLLIAAQNQGITGQEEFSNWINQLQWDNPDYWRPRLLQRLEEMVGDDWLFDPTLFSNPN